VLKKISRVAQVAKNMGLRYIIFRSSFEFKKRSGLLKKRFPISPPAKTFCSLNKWKETAKPFFFNSKEELKLSQPLSEKLRASHRKLSMGEHLFFSSLEFNLGTYHDWITNPDSGFKYDNKAHWTDINDYSKEAGDIKFVWELSRFSNIYTFIRYEQYSGLDGSEQVFREIEDWIDNNVINSGPNFKCSQEISLRILNWTFALYYYKNSPRLTEEFFAKVQHYIYWQTRHVYDNINFSRIAVRNNHAITETLTLYLVGLLYPDLDQNGKWKKDGKRWFEQEIAYQIYKDGTFLQFSMNYHRVVIQLLTWAIRLADLNQERFADEVYDRAKKSLIFLTSCIDKQSGWLPNYGANDGALFFKLNDNHYRDYRPQLEALSYSLGLKWELAQCEDAGWYGLQPISNGEAINLKNGIAAFKDGGYYVFRQDDSLVFIRCGNHRDRPMQADNLHLDIWHNGENLLHDAGSYKYNTDESTLRYFMGTRSHNTVMLDSYDQMEKGPRFIWYHWSQCNKANVTETAEAFVFEGTIKAFQHVNKNIRHYRKVTFYKNKSKCEVEDNLIGVPQGVRLHQLWHTCYPDQIDFNAVANNQAIQAELGTGYYSSFYGKKESCTEYSFTTTNNTIKTTIVFAP